jgi:hypothetical protein
MNGVNDRNPEFAFEHPAAKEAQAIFLTLNVNSEEPLQVIENAVRWLGP